MRDVIPDLIEDPLEELRMKNEGVNRNSVKSVNRKKGNAIETEASAYLMRNGYEILDRNYAYRGGELDIVARDGQTVVFVEVKSVWTA